MDKELLEIIQQMPLEEFIEKLTIINKHGKQQQFQLNAEQKRMLEAAETGEDILILKARQMGSTTFWSAYLFALAYRSDEPVTYAILSYKLESSKQILKMHKNFYYSLPTALQRPLEVDNTTQLAFEGGGRIIAAAATQQGGLRSFTATKIHISEYAFADDPEELKATALAAVNDGQIIIESTANYYNDCLHKEIKTYELKQAQWNYLFFPWYEHEEYTSEVPAKDLTDYESSLVKSGVTPEQITWRRRKVGKLGIEKFTREYPTTLEEAYRIVGNTYFSFKDFQDCEIITHDGEEWLTIAEPDQSDAYAIGVDVGGGVGRDYSVITVMSKRMNVPVCMWRSNQVTPIQLAEYIFEISEQYNSALVLVEANNYGLATINELGHQGCSRIWKEDGKDFLTTAKSKPLLFEKLKKEIQTGKISLLDSTTAAELRTIQTDDRGRIKFLDSSKEGHSDSAMALALACWCLDAVRLKDSAYLPDWILQRKAQRIKELAGAGTKAHRRY
jgi:hypothetical protein